MCKDCFETEYYKFNTSEEFDIFLKEFNSKIAKTVQFVSAEKYKIDFHHIYQCINCREFWWFSDLDNHWHGYFLKEKNAKMEVDKDERKGKLLKFGCLIIVGLVILILIEISTS